MKNMKMNMKKMNSKGFTLIELLAIIVILAVILVVAVPQILDVMDNSKLKSLQNSAKSVASGWNNNLAAAQLTGDTYAMDLSKDDWKCITTEAASTLGISTNDYLIDEKAGGAGALTPNDANPNCSMAKLNTAGAVEVILVADEGGSLYLADAKGSSTNMWARSDGSHSWSD